MKELFKSIILFSLEEPEKHLSLDQLGSLRAHQIVQDPTMAFLLVGKKAT